MWYTHVNKLYGPKQGAYISKSIIYKSITISNKTHEAWLNLGQAPLFWHSVIQWFEHLIYKGERGFRGIVSYLIPFKGHGKNYLYS